MLEYIREHFTIAYMMRESGISIKSLFTKDSVVDRDSEREVEVVAVYFNKLEKFLDSMGIIFTLSMDDHEFNL